MKKTAFFAALVGALALAGGAFATQQDGGNGPAGPQGAAWTPTYGIAQVLVDRGHGASAWATYSTSLGSPVGDTTGGAFRFTCNDAQAPCKVSVQAYTTDSGSVALYPRVLIHTQSLNGGPESYCEYGDGTDNNGGTATLTNTATAVTLGIGGSLDCNAGQTRPDTGVVSDIWVPAGYYDVFSTFTFKK